MILAFGKKIGYYRALHIATLEMSEKKVNFKIIVGRDALSTLLHCMQSSQALTNKNN